MRVIALSAATASKASEIGVPKGAARGAPLGVELPLPGYRTGRRQPPPIQQRLALVDGSPVLLTPASSPAGRAARWLSESALPQIDPRGHLCRSRSVPGEATHRAVAEPAGVVQHIPLLGRVTDDAREELMTGADIFLAPNVPVAGDMEGFGPVTVQTAIRGALVDSAEPEGIKNAVVPRRTGILVPAGDVTARVSELTGPLADRGSWLAPAAASGRMRRS